MEPTDTMDAAESAEAASAAETTEAVPHSALKNPFMDYNHVRLEESADGRAVCTLTLRPESRNPYGYAHGGAIYTIADDVAGYAAHTDGRHHVTQSSNLYFLSNQRTGTLTGRAEVRRRGRTTCLVEVTVTGEDGTLIAAGSFVYFCVDRTAER